MVHRLIRNAAVGVIGVLVVVGGLATAATAASSGGSGGAFTDRTRQTFTAGNGLTSQYHIYAQGIPQDRPVGLLLQFHGDGAYEFNNPTSSYSLGGSTGIIAQARSRGLITVPVLAPDTSGTVTWWESGSTNADFVRDLLRYLLGQYNVDTERIWLVGYSGGAQFVTQFLVPRHSAEIDGGGAVVFGGGGSPRGTVSPFAPGFVQDFPMHWYTGLEDDGGNGYDALSDARAGSAWYAARSFPVTIETPAGVNHNLSGRFGPVVGAQLDIHDSGTSPTPPPEPNRPPVADAGVGQNVSVLDLVALDGSGSSDPDAGDVLDYSWSFSSRPQGSTATLTDRDEPDPTFVADRHGTYVVALTVTDDGGLSASDTVTVQASDTVPPVISYRLTPPNPNGAAGWFTSPVTVDWTVTDAGSGVASTAGCVDAVVSADQAATTYSCSAVDGAGNPAGPVQVSVKKDGTAPTISWSGEIAADGAYVAGSVPASPRCTATDVMSGVDAAGCVVTGYGTSFGRHTLTATAGDIAGNVGTVTRSYAVTATDVPPGAAFYDDIMWLATEGITRGAVAPDGSVIFGPEDWITREAMAAFVYRFMGEPAFTPPTASPFTDVRPGAAFYPEITWLEAEGIAPGAGDPGGSASFGPSDTVTREVMALWVYRALAPAGYTPPTTSPFVDVATSHRSYTEIAWMATSGLSTGVPLGNGTAAYYPDDPIRREAMAAFFHRAESLRP